MLKKSVLPVVLTAGLLATLLVPQQGLALSESQRIQQELSRLKNSEAQLKKKNAQTEQELNRIQQEKQQVTNDINTILQQIDTTNQKLTQLNEQIESETANLEQNAIQLEEAEERVAARDQLLRSRIRLMYMNGVVSYADVLFSSTSFSDFLDRLNALKSIVGQDKKILEDNKKDRNLIAEKRVQIEQQLELVKNLYAQTSAIKQELLVKEKEKEVKIASLSEQEKQLELLSEEEDKQLMKLARETAAAQQRLRAAKQAEAAQAARASGKGSSSAQPTVAFSGGKFAYPLPKVVNMSSDFGKRRDPFTGKTSSHSGIDLPSPAGTDILAAEDGYVILAQWWSGYGNAVIIDHGNNVWTLYGHIRNDGIKVKKGDYVKRGQKIAEVGSTGRSTGNHLHFEVRVNETPVDPKPYLR